MRAREPRLPAQPAAPARLTPKGRAMRELLLTAAAKMFAELGYEQTRVSDLVQHAQTSHGNFYRHFKDKDEILLAILEPLIEEVRASSRAGATHVDRLPTEAEFADRNIAFFRVYAKHRRLLRVMREAASRGGSASSFLKLWLAQRDLFIMRTERWLGGLQARGLIARTLAPRALAEALGSMTEQLAYVKIGLAARSVPAKEIEELGRTCGRIWFLSIAGSGVSKP
jgi:AcrR family transcriptional regulator